MSARHPWLARFVPALDALVAVSELDPCASDEAVVWRAPAFTWAPGTGEQGRKGAGRLMPLRVHWNVLSGGPGVRTGSAVGPGVLLDVEAEPDPVTVSRLRSAAGDARWALFRELDFWAAKAVASAHAVRSAEVASNRGVEDVPLLDPPALEAVADELMVGEHGFFKRMLDLIVRPACFDRVDPLRWIRTMLRRDADQAVGRAIGDVLPGPRIRRLAAEHRGGEPLNLDRIIALYNRGVSRSNRVGAARAARALLVGGLAPARLSEERLMALLPFSPGAEDVYLGES